MKDRFVLKRVTNIVWLFLVTLLMTAAISLIHGSFLDELCGFLFLDVVFFVLFLFVLEYSRQQRFISGNRETDYKKILIGYFCSALVLFACSFFPEFLKPVILIPLFMNALGTKEIAVCTGIFFNSIMCLALGSSTQELILYCLMTLFGCMLSEAADNPKYRFWSELIIFCLSAMLPGLFWYLAYRETKASLFLSGAFTGLIANAFLLAFYERLTRIKNQEVPDMLMDILEESYPLARELSKFSKAEYQHGRRVSDAAAKCAGIVGADERICAAAGFYYRIGIIEGETLAESGCRLTQKECFPEEVIRIISEYNGELSLPSTIESAIVHMVDGLIKKLEVLDGQTTMSSEWNQDMVIYQTLNDFSAKGLYDKSGLSMNMFLKIREYLVKEEALL